jgi:hypothetical protein
MSGLLAAAIRSGRQVANDRADRNDAVAGRGVGPARAAEKRPGNHDRAEEFHYELTGTGWAAGRISIDGVSCEVTASPPAEWFVPVVLEKVI